MSKQAQQQSQVAPLGFRRKSLASYLGISPAGVDKLVSRGELPRPVKLGRTPIWPRATIDKFIAEKTAAA